MSKADCEQFNFNDTGVTTPEIAGQAVAHKHDQANKAGIDSVVPRLKLIAEEAEKLTAAARTKVRDLQIAEANENTDLDSPGIDLQPHLQAAWDGLCLAWYQLKLQNGHGGERSRH